MRGAEVFQIFTRPLSDAGLEYMVTGSVASTVYGEPRLTHDIDIVLDPGKCDVSVFPAAFPQSGFYCPPEEVLAIECSRSQRGHFNIIHHGSGYKADIYLRGDDVLNEWGLSRKKLVEIDGTSSLWLAPPEYVILRKLQFHKEGRSQKHIDDIRGMLEMSGDLIEVEPLGEWVVKLGLEAEWDLLDTSG